MFDNNSSEMIVIVFRRYRARKDHMRRVTNGAHQPLLDEVNSLNLWLFTWIVQEKDAMAANLRSLEARLDNMKGDFDRRGTAFFLFAFCLLPSAIHRLTIRQSDNIQTDRRALSINSHLSSLLTFQFSFFAKLSFPFCFSLHSISLCISINTTFSLPLWVWLRFSTIYSSFWIAFFVSLLFSLSRLK